MRISFSTGTFYHRPLSYSLELAREVGFDGVEVVLGVGYLLRGVEPLRQALLESGIPALSVHPPFFSLPGWPRDPRASIPRAVKAARELEAGLCVAHTIFLRDPRSPRGRVYERALASGVSVGQGEVIIGVESNQYDYRQRRFYLDDLRRLTEYAQERNCAITFDTCHAGANGEDLLEDYEIIRPILRNVHLSDVTRRAGDLRTHVLPGQGDLPLRPFLAALARDKYSGLITMEIHPREVGLWNREQAAQKLSEALAFVRESVAAPEPLPEPEQQTILAD